MFSGLNQETSGVRSWMPPMCASLRFFLVQKHLNTRTINIAEVFTEVAGVVQPNPSPRFSRTKEGIQGPPSHEGQDTDAVLSIGGL